MNKFKHLMIAICVAAFAFTAVTGTVAAEEAEEAPAPAVEEDDGDIAVGVLVGWDLDFDEIVAGVDARFSIDLLDGVDIIANPSVYVMPLQLGDFITLNTSLNFLVEPDLDAPVDPFVGPGLGVPIMVDPDFDVDFGINAVAGVGFDLDAPVDPFAQLNIYRNLSPGFTNLTIMAGAHF